MGCNRCGRHFCNCDIDCGCPIDLSGACVFYKGVNLSCIGVTKNDDYDSILVNINDIICDITPSGTIYVGTTGQIDVTGNVISLDPIITTAIINLQTEVISLQNCCDDSVKDITSSTIVVTEPTPGNFVINYTSPPPTPSKDGVVYNNPFSSQIPSGGGVQIAEAFNRDYITLNSLAVGDEIRFVIEGVPNSTGSLADDFIFDVFNAGTATIAGFWEFNSFSPSTNLSSFRLEGSISVRTLSGSNTGLISLKLFLNAQTTVGQPANGFGISGAVYKNFSTIFSPTWANLSLRAKFRDNTTTATATITNFMVEVRKKI